MYYPTLKEARALAQSGPYGQVPVTRELLSDFITPIQALRILRSQDNHCFLLESAADSQGWGRYSFLGFEPSLEVTCKDGIVQLKSETGEPLRPHLRPPARPCGSCSPPTKARACPACPPLPADWWATSPMTTSSMPNPVCT